jgi:hypothetical protein
MVTEITRITVLKINLKYATDKIFEKELMKSSNPYVNKYINGIQNKVIRRQTINLINLDIKSPSD